MRHAVSMLLASSFLATATGAHAQIAQESPAETLANDGTIITESTPDPGQDVVVIGSRAQGRTIADSPVPIDVIGGDTLAQSGFTDINRALRDVVPSFNFPQPSITDGTDVIRPATLRGLSPDQTLVLVNGKRRHTSALLNINGSVGRGSAAVDLNTIPTLAIDRIEVLRDGAASLYGSDAIAGVINVQLRRRPGGRAQVSWGKYYTNLQEVPEATGLQLAANGQPVRDADGNFVLTTTGEDLRVRDGQQVTLAATVGLPLGQTGYANFTAEYRGRERTDRSGYDPRPQYPLVGGLVDPRELTVDRRNHLYGDADTDDLNLFVNAGADLGGDFEVYTFGSYGVRDGTSAGFFRRPNDARNRNFSASTTSFVPFYADGFLPLITTEIEDVSGAVGVRGTVGGFSADLSYVYGHNSLNFGVRDSFNTSFGAGSKQSFDAGGLRFGQSVVNLDLQREFQVGFAESLSFAIGGEYRDENYRIIAGELQSYAAGPFAANGAPAGAQVFPGFRPANEVDASRDSYAGYIEFDAKVSDAFSVQIAGRYENFSDFGDTVNGKIAARFAPVDWAALRGSVSTGFRAPSLQQQFFATSSTNNVNGVLLEIGTFPVSSPVAIALGAQPLTAEKSTNYGGGITLNPVSGLTLTADYYRIDIRDRIIVTDNLQGAAVVGVLQAAGFRDITTARFFINGVDTSTEGVDVVASYRAPDFGVGRFTLTGGYNYNKTEIEEVSVLSPIASVTLFGRQSSLQLTRGQPRDKINLGLDWDLAPFSATVRTNRFGSVLSPGVAASTDIELRPRWITDLELRADLPLGFDVAVGANNVFDVYPTRLPAGGIFGANNYFLPYSSFSPFGFNGRFLYARVGVNF